MNSLSNTPARPVPGQTAAAETQQGRGDREDGHGLMKPLGYPEPQSMCLTVGDGQEGGPGERAQCRTGAEALTGRVFS